jgi:hypothetical protein
MRLLNENCMNSTKIIVVTTVRDEAWTLDRFLQSCSEFADHILVDDDSTGIDRSRSIYPHYPKVTMLDGANMHFEQRRKRIFAEARKIPAQRRIIVALDSDELLSANLFTSPEWRTVLAAPPGTCIFVHRYDLWGTAGRYRDEASVPGLWVCDRTIWVDDGVSAIAEKGYQGMHMAYTPETDHSVRLNEIVCLHYQFCNRDKVNARYRFYRVHEKAVIRKLSDLEIWRAYSQHELPTGTLPCPREWFEEWEQRGIDMTSTTNEDLFHYDIEVLKLFEKHGMAFFARQDLWFANWAALREKAIQRGFISKDFPRFPPYHRSLFVRLFHYYARRTNTSWRIKQWESRLRRRNG